MNTTDPFAGERLKLSPFHSRQQALNIRDAWSSWNGYKFADYYYDAEFEYFCIRNACATYDICPMQKYEIKGPDAEAMLNRMVTRDVKNIGLNRVGYSLWLYRRRAPDRRRHDFQAGRRSVHAHLRQSLHRLAGQERVWLRRRRGHRHER